MLSIESILFPRRPSARSGAAAILLLLVATVLSGCLETEQKVVLNPNGSGKMTLHIIQPDLRSMFGGGSTGPKQEQEEEKVRQYLAPILNSKGIEAWSDVTFRTLKDGRIEFQGTAYFRSLDSVKLEGNGGTPLELKREGETATIRLRPNLSQTPDTETERPELTPEQVTRAADSLRNLYETAQPMLNQLLGGLREEISLSLPLQATDAKGWHLDPSGRTASFTIDGGALLNQIDTLVNAPGFWEEQARNGDAPQAKVLAEILGVDDLYVTFPLTGSQQFNYAKEVAAAQKQTAAIRKRYKVPDTRTNIR